MDFILPVLIVAFMVLLSALDARTRKKKGTPQVQSRPYLEDLASVLEEEEEEVVEAPVEEAEVREEQPDAPRAAEEGERAVHKTPRVEVPETENPEPKLRIDKKNLILYSEILKPKFDD